MAATAGFKLRMPEDLRAMVEEAAAADGVSLNHEICRRLGVSFKMDELREATKLFADRETQYQNRINQLTDVLLQLTTKGLKR